MREKYICHLKEIEHFVLKQDDLLIIHLFLKFYNNPEWLY